MKNSKSNDKAENSKGKTESGKDKHKVKEKRARLMELTDSEVEDLISHTRLVMQFEDGTAKSEMLGDMIELTHTEMLGEKLKRANTHKGQIEFNKAMDSMVEIYERDVIHKKVLHLITIPEETRTSMSDEEAAQLFSERGQVITDLRQVPAKRVHFFVGDYEVDFTLSILDVNIIGQVIVRVFMFGLFVEVTRAMELFNTTTMAIYLGLQILAYLGIIKLVQRIIEIGGTQDWMQK